MKTILVFGCLWLLAGVALAGPETAPLVVHEWGTFTTVSGSDGRLLPGLEREEQALPPFVYSHAGFSPANKGWSRPVANVTVKMETPVLYFYSPAPQTVEVDVGFEGGSISQWFPERARGEKSLPFPEFAGGRPVQTVPPVDFARGYRGSAAWRVEVLAPDSKEELSVRHRWETPEMRAAFPAIAHWERARVASANKIRGVKGEVEGFIFYRGVGNFPLPLEVTAAGENLVLRNMGAERIPFLFVYEKRAVSAAGGIWWSGGLGAGACETVTRGDPGRDVPAAFLLERKFPGELERAGLTPDEARAMIATWRESYFEREGLRVFWIVPRSFTDRVLPISISPTPEKLERVLVGRSEVLTPEFERELAADFRADGGKRWMTDRYYSAYRARAQQLGVVLPEPSP